MSIDTPITIRAPAKINLTLEVFGRRDDGYHDLQSLVAFGQDAGDLLEVRAAPAANILVVGPFATDISPPNILDRTIAELMRAQPGLTIGAVTLHKHLPIASGIGGGSADAAALMRAVSKLNPCGWRSTDWLAIARTLGADVPVCFASKATLVRGIGDRLAPVSLLPPVFAVLACPDMITPPDKTSQVFRALNAPAANDAPEPTAPPTFSGFDDVIAYMKAHPNDLTTTASHLFPLIPTAIKALADTNGCQIARLSGAGPTCFGLFRDKPTAEAAAAHLREQYATWWICTTRLC